MKNIICIFVWLAIASCPLSGGAAITVTYGSADGTGGFGDNSLSLNPPAGTQAGDILIAQIATPGDAVTSFGAPAGWTLISTASSTNNANIDQRIYYLALTGTAAASYSWTIWDWNSRSAGVIYSVRGALAPNCGASNTANCAGARQTGGGSSVIAPNISSPPSYPAGSLRMAFFADAHGSTTITPALENSATAGRYYRAGSGANGMGIHGSYYVMASASNGGGQSASLGNGQSNVGSTLLLASSATSSIHHIQVELTGTPLTCTPSTLTVKACTNAACSTLSSASTTVNLSASSGTLGNTSLTFTGSTTTTLRRTTVGTVTLDATSTPAEASSTVCTVNGTVVAGCNVPFVDSGFLISTIPQQTAGQTSGTVTISAVRKSDNSLACTPAFASQTRSVKLTPTYSNPNTGTMGLVVGGVASASGVPLNFDGTGKASFTFSYPDVGYISLNARYDGVGTDAGLVMNGGSNTFLTIPYALCVDSPDANWGCTAGDTSCTKFTSAGTAFNLRVTGRALGAGSACSMPITPNYMQNGLVLSSTIVAPSGGANGSLSPSTVDIPIGGIVSTGMSEVGVFTITATPPANGYFGVTLPPATSGNSGRFVPAGFTVTSNTVNDRSDINTKTALNAGEDCSSDFTYTGESLRSLFMLTAVNANGVTTTNYRGAFARLNVGVVSSAGNNGLAFGAQNGATLFNSRLTAACASCGAFSAGVANIAADLTVQRLTGSGTTVDGPYNGMSFGVVATDADLVGMRNPSFNWNLAGAAEGLALGSTNLYFGRARVDNAYGSLLSTLPVRVYTEYWTGTGFTRMTTDSCSRITVPATVSMSSTPTATLYCNGGVGLYGSLTGVAATIGGVTAGNAATLSNGSATISLSKPTNSGGGYLDLAVSVPDYLKYNVDGVDQTLPGCGAVADSYLHDDNPRARIRFGARTNDKVLYLREVY